MKKLKYTCDLCKAKRTEDELTGLYFKDNKIIPEYVLTNDVQNANKHICLSCVEVCYKYHDTRTPEQTTF